MTDETSASVARLLDLAAIQKLKGTYFRMLDTKAWSEFRQLFTDDLRYFRSRISDPFHPDPTATSADEFIDQVSSYLAEAVTVHHGHTPEIDFVDDLNAVGVWAMYDWVQGPSDGISFEGQGHYHEKYRKCDDGLWRIAELRLTRLRYTPQPSDL